MLTCYLFPFLTEFSHLPENRSFSSKTIHSISRALLSFICSVCPQILPIDERQVGERALSLQDFHPIFGVIACRMCPIPFFASAIFHHGKKFIVSLSFRAIHPQSKVLLLFYSTAHSRVLKSFNHAKVI